MTNTVYIISENEFTISKFGNLGGYITYDDKQIFSMLFDTRNSEYIDGQLILDLNRIPRIYINLIDIILRYCHDQNLSKIHTNDRHDILTKLTSDIFNSNSVNKLILVEFRITYISTLVNNEIIKCDVLINNLNQSFLGCMSKFYYKNKAVPNEYWKHGKDACKNVVKYLHKNIETYNDYINICLYVCENGYIEILIYLHQNVKLSFENNDLNVCFVMACQNGHIDIVKYLHNAIGLTKKDLPGGTLGFTCMLACRKNSFDVIKYLYKNFGLTKNDFRDYNGNACASAAICGSVDFVKYLHKDVGLTKKDFQSYDNVACEYVCVKEHLDIVKYFHGELGFTKEDYCNAYSLAVQFKKNSVIEYLNKQIGFIGNDHNEKTYEMFKSKYLRFCNEILIKSIS